MAKVVPMKKKTHKPTGENPRTVAGSNSGISPKVLKGIVDEIEVAEEEKRVIGEHIKEIYTAAKEKDYDVKVIRSLVADRRKDKEELRLFKEKREQYAFALDPELADVLS